MANNNRIELDSEVLDNISGGNIGFNPDGNGTYTMKCGFTGNQFYGVSLSQIIKIAQYAASIPNTLEGEEQIIAWAQQEHII